MNGYYLFFILIILFNIKIIVPFYDELLQVNMNFDFDEDNKNVHILKSNIKNLFLYGAHLGEFLISQDKNNTSSLNDTIKLYKIFKDELGYILSNVNMSSGCREYLEKYLIGKNESYPYGYSTYHVRKLMDDSSKHRNDLSTYEQCMNKYYKVENISEDNGSRGNKTSTFVVYTLDRRLEKEDDKIMYPKNSTDFEQIYFIRGFCLPQSEKDICDIKDYRNFLTGINDDLDDLLGINITRIYSFTIRENENEFTNLEYFVQLIPLYICLIQVCLVIFREIIIFSLKNCCKYNIKTEKNDLLEEFNQTNNNENDEDDDENENDNDNEKKVILNQKNAPKWIIIYNKCFNFTENFKELFNFKLNSTSINNDSGLSYIRGLKATSLFMLVAGLTFLTLMNSLSIIFSKTLFLEFLDNKIFYSLFFVGLRYAPRLIFSCSGYTLSYKFLSYIDKNFSFLSVIKFIFYQSHKYLILIGYSLFQRYSLYPLFSFYKNTPMWKFLYISLLQRPDNFNYFLSFFTLSSFFIGQNKRYDQTIIDYFWLPYNEIAFFICGIIIISFGYKFKLRIDYFLLIITFILYIFKIVFTYLYVPGDVGYKEKFYPTLYYYLFDYGKFMTNPLFNYPSYFIGMYFGFINYCVQKGIISINLSDLFQNKNNISTRKESEKEMNLSINANKSIEEEEEDDDDDDEDKEDNNNIKQNFDENDKSNIRTEIIEMPFLIAGVKISNWLRNHRARLISFLMIVLFFGFIAIHFFVLYFTVISDYNQKKELLIKTSDSEQEEICKDIKTILTLEKYLTNDLINFIYRIDIEIVVFLLQSLLFIFYFKGKNFVNNFFCHIFWAMFNKSYFSYILVANPIIIFIFYKSETKILLNLYNLILYSLISGTIIFISASFSYIFFELPYKKLIRIICSNDAKNNELEENENEKEEDNKSEDEDD